MITRQQIFRAGVWTLLGTIGVCLVLAFFAGAAGCSKSGPETFTPAIASTLPAERVRSDAVAWVQVDPASRYFATVADTHSMEPFFTKRSLPLCLRYAGQSVVNGTVAIVQMNGLHVIHVIAAQTEQQVRMAGYNNHDSDGWFPKTAIEGIVVGQLYLP